MAEWFEYDESHKTGEGLRCDFILGDLLGEPDTEYEVWLGLVAGGDFTERVACTTSAQGKASCELPIVECSSGSSTAEVRAANVDAKCRKQEQGSEEKEIRRDFVRYCCSA
jgi:hypothetical protein